MSVAPRAARGKNGPIPAAAASAICSCSHRGPGRPRRPSAVPLVIAGRPRREALRQARRLYALSPDRATARLLAVCHVLCGNWTAAVAAGNRGELSRECVCHCLPACLSCPVLCPDNNAAFPIRVMWASSRACPSPVELDEMCRLGYMHKLSSCFQGSALFVERRGSLPMGPTPSLSRPATSTIRGVSQDSPP